MYFVCTEFNEIYLKSASLSYFRNRSLEGYIRHGIYQNSSICLK